MREERVAGVEETVADLAKTEVDLEETVAGLAKTVVGLADTTGGSWTRRLEEAREDSWTRQRPLRMWVNKKASTLK